MRDVQVRCLPKRATMEDKRPSPRSIMTTSGMKTFRIQPTVNNSALAKYQPRSGSAPPQPRAHSTPVPPPRNDSDSQDDKSQQSSAVSKRSASPKAPILGSTCSSPTQYYRTSDSYHTRTFTPRSRSCTPPHLYMAEHVRKAADQLHRVSSGSCRQTASSNRTDRKLDDSEIPTRFGKPINLPTFMKTNPHLKNKDLSMGQKQYLWGIARIYSISHMKTQVQQQYQALLDHEFRKRVQRMGISEREKVKEMKDYLRYKKFIKNYDQRIPRNMRSKDSAEERTNDASHIHRHVIKGWTTNVTSRDRYNDESSCGETGDQLDEVERDCKQKSARGAHIYKHVIKGWTMDPNANDVFQKISPGTKLTETESGMESKSETESENDDVIVYRVDISNSGGKDNNQDDVMKISRVYGDADSNFL